jgi:hypothetical protein
MEGKEGEGMTSAIYIENGTVQLVLTPETEIDKKVLTVLEKSKGLETYRGSFYDCQGGWIRHRSVQNYYEQSDYSLIFRVREEKIEEPVISAVP